MLLATLADEPGGGGGVTWQQGTFDPEKYGIMTVNGKVVRSGPSATGDSFWDQSATPSEERSIVIRDSTPQTSAPAYKTPQDAIVNQYVQPTINTPINFIESIADTVKSVITPLDLPMAKPVAARTEYVTRAPDYVTAAPSYFSLDSIFKSLGIDSSKPKYIASAPQQQQQKKPAQQQRPSSPSTPRTPTPMVFVQSRQSNINPIQMPQFQSNGPRLKSTNTMLPVIAMGAAGIALLLLGITLINRKKKA